LLAVAAGVALVALTLRLVAALAAVVAVQAVLIFGCLAPATLARLKQSLLVQQALAALRVLRRLAAHWRAKARAAA
jgi:hypothetical protein